MARSGNMSNDASKAIEENQKMAQQRGDVKVYRIKIDRRTPIASH